MKEAMRRNWRRFLLPAVVLLLCLVWSGTALAESTVELHYGGILDYTKANQVAELVNQQRTANGKSKLTQTGDLQQMAMIRAMEIALYYSHTRPNGNRGLDIMASGATRAENIAGGYTTASAAMNGWMNSSGHRDNILRGDIAQMGIGCCYMDGTYWWVQLFRGGSATGGSVKSGQVNSAIRVYAKPSILNIYLVKADADFRKDGIINMEAGETGSVIAVNCNTGSGSASRCLSLYASSPGLSWKADGGSSITVLSTKVGASLYAGSCGSKNLTLTCGSRTFKARVSVAHKAGSAATCTKDATCSFCGTVVQRATGHKNTSCAYKTCSRCGALIPPTGEHTPGPSATCTSACYCQVCGVKLQDALGHNFEPANCQAPKTCTRCDVTTGGLGSHIWGGWTTSGNWRTRRCTICHKPQTEYLRPNQTGSSSTNGSSTNGSSTNSTANKNKKVTSVRITGSTSLTAGKSTTLKAVVSPSNASNKAVSWSSSNKKYATVSSKGVVTAKAAGAGKTVTITAKAKDGSGKKATIKIKIKKASKVKVKSIKITGKKTMLAGKKITLKAKVSPSNAASKAVSWSSSNKKYATVSSKGVVTAKAAGAGKTVTITAKAKDGSGKKATYKIKIKGPVKKITLKGSKSLKAGKKTTIKATVKIGKGGSKALSWSSSNKKYATVSSKGVVTAKKAGKGRTVTITAKAKDGSGKKATIKIRIK